MIRDILILANQPPRRPIPGYRFFVCDECGHKEKIPTRDCHSPSGEDCRECGCWMGVDKLEEHPEWPTDGSGNLLPGQQ